MQKNNALYPVADATAAVQAVSDTVSEREGKIVVTTTISLDRSALSEAGDRTTLARPRPNTPTSGAFDPLSEVVATAATAGTGDQDALAALTNSDTYHRMQEAVSDGRIQMLQMSPRVYLGLVSGRRRMRAHPLAIGDALFIFVSRNNSLTSMAELISQLLQKLPQETSWRTPEGAAHIEQIADALNRAGTATISGRL